MTKSPIPLINYYYGVSPCCSPRRSLCSELLSWASPRCTTLGEAWACSAAGGDSALSSLRHACLEQADPLISKAKMPPAQSGGTSRCSTTRALQLWCPTVVSSSTSNAPGTRVPIDRRVRPCALPHLCMCCSSAARPLPARRALPGLREGSDPLCARARAAFGFCAQHRANRAARSSPRRRAYVTFDGFESRRARGSTTTTTGCGWTRPLAVPAAGGGGMEAGPVRRARREDLSSTDEETGGSQLPVMGRGSHTTASGCLS